MTVFQSPESRPAADVGPSSHVRNGDEDFLADFGRLSAFGATADGGVDRQALTNADLAQREWFAELLRSRGFTVSYDAIGNQFGLLELVLGAPYVLTGSHLDSQPTSGRFDGAYGVLSAAYAAFRVAEEATADVESRNLAVVNWCNEEGSRFAPSMMGSAVYTGVLPLDDALTARDSAGTTVQDALEAAQCLPQAPQFDVAAFAEIHVEQGRILENSGVTLGLVTATWAARKYRMTVRGEQAHSGATIMSDRRDALLGAAMLVIAARQIADAFPGVVHTAVGQLDVYPNSPVVVASEVTLLLDIRAGDERAVALAADLLKQKLGEIEATAHVRIEGNLTHSWGIEEYQPEGVALARQAAQRANVSSMEIMTVAGHDSVNLKRSVLTVMLFVPSVAGVSHNTAELTSDSDMLAGLEVLTDVVRHLVRSDS